ncbi:hypothetical protein F8388_000550 [Cannabis sativa]|uniref:DUF4283 domain-containing protein n=1 Tax=Cannabis sativa TaxID=3483 RepID=A0A7J6EZU2_CANSA|nr:hypothetical protein F8388_000550 [Cannabis sativa]
MEQKNFHEFLQADDCDKDWSRAVIMFRNNSEMSWSAIFYNLSREINRKLVVSQMFDDRTLIWCKTEEEMESLLKINRTVIPDTGDTIISFVKWSGEEQHKEVKVDCRFSWIGVEGVPLNLWNFEIMRKIGELCGGLLDVEKDTAEKNFLHHMRLKWRGDEQGFVHESILLSHGGFEFPLKLFRLNDWGYRFSGFFNTIWHQDSEFYKNKEAENCQSSKETELVKEVSLSSYGQMSGESRKTVGASMVVSQISRASSSPATAERQKKGLQFRDGNEQSKVGGGTSLEIECRPRDKVMVTIENPYKKLRNYRGSVPIQKVFQRLWSYLNEPRVGDFSGPAGYLNLNFLWQSVEKGLTFKLGQEVMGRQVINGVGQTNEGHSFVNKLELVFMDSDQKLGPARIYP